LLRALKKAETPYGSPRVRLDLRELGHRCGKNRVARLMRESGLRARQKRRFRPRTTDSRHSHKIAENWLAKLPAPDRPGQLWQSDITYIETQEGWLYLAFTLDGCSRRGIAHACRGDMLGELTTTTFKHAVICQRPSPGLIHHSDRGSQYAAEAFQHCLRT
jgi:putative transposase